MRLIITNRTKNIYTTYRAEEVSVHRARYKRAAWGGYDLSRLNTSRCTTRSPRMVTECFLTRTMLIKMYYHFMVCACICTIVFTVSQFHADVYLVYFLTAVTLRIGTTLGLHVINVLFAGGHVVSPRISSAFVPLKISETILEDRKTKIQ